MKVVLFDYVFEPKKPGITGLSDLVWNWAEHLIAMGEEVNIVAPYPEHVKPPEGSIVHSYPVPFIGYRNVIGHFLIALKGWQEIRKLEDVDLVHAPEYLSTGVFVLFSKDIPILQTVPGNIYERIANGNPFDWSMTQVLKICARLSARRCTHTIVTSEKMRRWWRKTGVPDDRMTLIPYGVDTNRFYPIANTRSEIGLSPDKKIILYVGRLSHEKGVLDLLEAAKSILTKYPASELHFVGDGILKPQLEQSVQQCNLGEQVIFHGWVDQPNLPKYYSAADVTVLPSYSEGMPRTMIETLACGSPFIGAKITGIIDHIEDKQTGLLIEPGNVSQLQQALSWVIENPQEAGEIAQNGLAYVKQNLTWQAIVRRMRDEAYLKAIRS